MEKDKHLGLRIDSETHGKLKSLAEFEGRSINGEVLYLIRQAIAQHEKDHGTLNKEEDRHLLQAIRTLRKKWIWMCR